MNHASFAFDHPTQRIEVYPTVIESVDLTKLTVREPEVVVVKYHFAQETSQPYTHIKYQDQQALMFSLRPPFYGIIPLKSVRLKDILTRGAPATETTSLPDLVEHIREDPELASGSRPASSVLESFTMAPTPALPPPPSSPQRTQASTLLVSPSYDDPREFLESRYYSILYSPTTPLTYFPKTTLPRVANLCRKSSVSVSSVLESMCIDIGKLDQRHRGRIGCLNPEESVVSSRFEDECRTHFISQHQSAIDRAESSGGELSDKDRLEESKFAKTISDLKVREAHLQLLMLLEIMAELDADEQKFLDEGRQRQEREMKRKEREARKSMVRHRKRKIVPTFLGMGAVVAPDVSTKPDTAANSPIDQFYAWYLSLTSLIERLILWDTLSATSSTYTFLGYVVVPYFNTKLPVIVKHLIDRTKESTVKVPKRRSSKPRLNRAKSLSAAPERENTPSTSSTVSDGASNTGSVLSPAPSFDAPPATARPSQRRSSSEKTLRAPPRLTKSLSNADFIPPTMKRNNSGLSQRQLERRQVDFGTTAKRSKSVSAGLAPASPPSSQSSAIFGDARKKKKLSTQSFSQVAATPAKQRQTSLVPDSADRSSSNLLGRLIEASSESRPTDTPSLKRQNTFPFATPIKKGQPAEHYSPIIIDSPAVSATPQSKPNTDHISPFASAWSPVMITSPSAARVDVPATPLGNVTSSPIKMDATPSRSRRAQRVKPGQPIDVQSTPFFRLNHEIDGNDASPRKRRE
ncbi:hypothetical protein DICA1_F13234 [Diutina catenulata]